MRTHERRLAGLERLCFFLFLCEFKLSDAVTGEIGGRDDIAVTREIYGNMSHLAPETVAAVKVHDERKASDTLHLGIASRVLRQIGQTRRDRKAVHFFSAIFFSRRVPHLDRKLAARTRFFFWRFDRANADRIFTFYE